MAVKGFRTLPNVIPFTQESMRNIAEIARQCAQGKMNIAKTLTFTTSTSFTIFQDPRIGVDSVLVIQPLTANAGLDVPSIYTTSQTAQMATIHHSISANADRIYRIGILA